jgi:hypothetical protein
MLTAGGGSVSVGAAVAVFVAVSFTCLVFWRGVARAAVGGRVAGSWVLEALGVIVAGREFCTGWTCPPGWRIEQLINNKITIMGKNRRKRL